MNKFTNPQQCLYESQNEDPLFMYLNPVTGTVNFGKVRCGRCSISITNSLRPLLDKKLIKTTGDIFTVDLPSYSAIATGYVIKIIKE